jgi:hypothetical protein
MCISPGKEWTSMDLAALRGLKEDDRLGRKRLRNTIRDAMVQGCVERITYRGERRVGYRVIPNESPA